MIPKISSLLVIKLFFISSACAKLPAPTTETLPHISDTKLFLKETKNRPDLQVRFFRATPKELHKNSFKLEFAEALFLTGHYKESLQINLELYLNQKKLSYFLRNKNIFLIARNYQELNLPNHARTYYQQLLKQKNYYYLYQFAKFEANQQNFEQSYQLYQQALNSSKYKQYYIVNAYHRFLEEALVHYPHRDEFYQKIIEDLKKEKPLKYKIFSKALIW